MEENNMENQEPEVLPVPGAEPEPQEAKETGKKDEEFSLKWHLKVLAVIYVILGIFYIILKIFLK